MFDFCQMLIYEIRTYPANLIQCLWATLVWVSRTKLNPHLFRIPSVSHQWQTDEKRSDKYKHSTHFYPK